MESTRPESPLGKARRLATEWFGDDKDKAGVPYILHLEHVAELVAPLGNEYAVVGLLHDSIEDGKTTWQNLVMHFGVSTANSVGFLTRPEGMEYAEYIASISACSDPVAKAVKIADLIDNLRDVGNPDFERLHQRYMRALRGLLFVGENALLRP